MKNNIMRIALILCLCVVVFAAWDKDKPASSTSLRNSNPEMLANQSALETSFGNEHEFSTGGTNSGDHTQGQARSFSQATAPATQIDGGAFASTDLGSLWVDTDDNAFYMLTATTPTWTPVSTEVIAIMLGSARVFGSTLGVTGNFAVNTNKFTVVATNGNTVVAGTLGVTGVATVAKGSLLASSDAPTTDAMIANKKYIDDQVGTKAFGEYTDEDDDGNAMLKAHAYLANQDGLVTAHMTGTAAGQDLRIFIGDTDDPAGTGDNIEAQTVHGNAEHASVTTRVASGKYFEVTDGSGTATNIRWHPTGTLVKPTDQD